MQCLSSPFPWPAALGLSTLPPTPLIQDGMVPGWVPDPELLEAAEKEATELKEAVQAERRKRKKEGGLYADQGGGMAKNDGKTMSSKQKQKRKRGDPNGPSHNRDKW